MFHTAKHKLPSRRMARYSRLLRHVAVWSVCCSVLQCVGAGFSDMLQCGAVWCSVVQCDAVCGSVLQKASQGMAV